jgi:hypothetical protein
MWGWGELDFWHGDWQSLEGVTQMRMKQVLLAVALVTVLSLAASHAQAQVIGGGYIGFGRPGFGGVVGFGAPVVAPAPVVAAPFVPYVAPYPAVVVSRPLYAAPFYGVGWGYGPRYYGPRYYRHGYGRLWW